jgi:hypothetical protein
VVSSMRLGSVPPVHHDDLIGSARRILLCNVIDKEWKDKLIVRMCRWVGLVSP